MTKGADDSGTSLGTLNPAICRRTVALRHFARGRDGISEGVDRTHNAGSRVRVPPCYMCWVGENPTPPLERQRRSQVTLRNESEAARPKVHPDAETLLRERAGMSPRAGPGDTALVRQAVGTRR